MAQIRRHLYSWVRELPPELRLFRQHSDSEMNEYHFPARQIHIMYFVVLAILFRDPSSTTAVSSGSLLAASFIAAIFEEFIIRDEIRFVGPAIYKFFLLTAGITLLPARNIGVLRSEAQEDYTVIKKSLKQFSHRYPSALATLNMLETLEQSQEPSHESFLNRTPIEKEGRTLFREFGPGFCRLWDFCTGATDGHDDVHNLQRYPLGYSRRSLQTPREVQSGEAYPLLTPGDAGPGHGSISEPFGTDNMISGNDFSFPFVPSGDSFDDPMSWILDDWSFD